jgi:hypothetical protein
MPEQALPFRSSILHDDKLPATSTRTSSRNSGSHRSNPIATLFES